MDFKKTVFDIRPELVSDEGVCIRVNFDVEEAEVDVSAASGGEDGERTVKKTVFEAYVVRVPQPANYDSIVSAIVSAAYPADKMQAIINNHLLESDDENGEHEAEFKAMQDWRKHAKEIAKEVVESKA